VRPQFLTDFLPGDELTGTLQQERQNPKRLLLQTNPVPALGEFPFLEIGLEGSKTNEPAFWFAPLHVGPLAICAEF
jgi:hypothetical protein